MKYKAVPIRSLAELQRLKHLFKQKTGFDLMTQQELAIYQKVMQDSANSKKEARDEMIENNAEVQRWRTLTKEEKARSAIDRSTKGIRIFNDSKAGHDTTEEEARKKAVELARKSDTIKGE